MIWVARIACCGVIGRIETTSRAAEATSRVARDRGPVHRDVDALLDVPDGQLGRQQRALERERAADQERDEVLAPDVADVGDLVRDLAVAVDAVAGEIGSEVGAGREVARLGVAGVADLEHRARARVGDAEAQEVERVALREHDQVGLRVAGRERGRRPVVLAAPDRSALTLVASLLGVSAGSTSQGRRTAGGPV